MITNNNVGIIPEIFVSVVSIVAGVLIYISRIGFDNYGLLIIESIFVSFFIIYTPHIVSIMLLKKKHTTWYYSKPVILLFCIGLLVILGQFNTLEINIAAPVAVLGGVFCLTSILTSFNNKKSIVNSKLIILFVLLGIFFTTAYSTGFYNHPLWKEKLITGAWAHRDSFWFSTMSGMFKTYNVSSNGLDGLVPVHYHNLSHYIYGSFSNILNISTLTFFNIIVPIIITPIFFLSLLYCTKEIGNYYSLNLSVCEIYLFKYVPLICFFDNFF